jgi:hypothetical protein
MVIYIYSLGNNTLRHEGAQNIADAVRVNKVMKTLM